MLPPPRRFGALTVTLVAGDIAFRLVDAVVNAANDRLQLGGGVAGALRAAGGLAIQREADALAPAPLGAVVRTGAGDLLAQHVYHAVVIRYGHEGGTCVETVREAVRNVLVRAAEDDDVDSLALPLFGAGVGGLTIARSLEAILGALEEFESTVGRPLTVEVVVLEGDLDEARAAFTGFLGREAREAYEARLAAEYLEALGKADDTTP